MEINAISLVSPDFNLPLGESASGKYEPVKTDTPPPQEATTREPATREPDEKPEELRGILAEHNIALNFSRDERTGELVVKMLDAVTGENLRQLPTEVSLKLAAAQLRGQFVNETV